MNLTEGEIQVLASISQLAADGVRIDDQALNQRRECYWIFKEDWTGVCDLLVNKGLVRKCGEEWTLTEDGLKIISPKTKPCEHAFVFKIIFY